jgi:hypothetical protein
MVLQMLHLQKRVRPLIIYLPEEIDSIIKMMNIFYLFPEKFGFQLTILDISELKEMIPGIEPIMNDHLSSYREFIEDRSFPNPMNSYSFFIKTKDKHILYTSDIENTKQLTEYIENSEVIIIDALHPSKEDIFEVIDQKNKQIILVHGVSDEVRVDLETNNHYNVIIAEDGYQINI